MHLDETILQTKTVKSIVKVLRIIVNDMNPEGEQTANVCTIIREHEEAMEKVRFNHYGDN